MYSTAKTVPLMANMTEFGRTPYLMAKEFEELGYQLVIWPVSSLRVANKASADYAMGTQVWVQFQAVVTTLIWSGVVSVVAYKLVDMVLGLRVSEEEEREGLDISSHGESAYNR